MWATYRTGKRAGKVDRRGQVHLGSLETWQDLPVCGMPLSSSLVCYNQFWKNCQASPLFSLSGILCFQRLARVASFCYQLSSSSYLKRLLLATRADYCHLCHSPWSCSAVEFPSWHQEGMAGLPYCSMNFIIQSKGSVYVVLYSHSSVSSSVAWRGGLDQHHRP